MHSFVEPKLLWLQGPGKKGIGRKRQDSGLTSTIHNFFIFPTAAWIYHCKQSSSKLYLWLLTWVPQHSSALVVFCYLLAALSHACSFLKFHAICGSGFVLEKGTTDSLEPNKEDLLIQVNLNSSRETVFGILGLFPQTKGSQGCQESSNLILSRV